MMTSEDSVSRSGGFSLIEMLVVLLVIVIMVGLVTLNVSTGDGSRELEQQLRKLRAAAAYALDEAQFSGSDFGVLLIETVDDSGDQVLTAYWRQRLPAGWGEPLNSPDIFKPLKFPATARHQLLLEEQEVLTDQPLTTAEGSTQPQWLLFSSGETVPGELAFFDRGSDRPLWRLRWDPLARFELFRGESGDSEDRVAELVSQ